MEQAVTMRDLWENKQYLKLKCNVQSLVSLQSVTNLFIRQNKDLAELVILKPNRRTKKPCAYITDVNEFIERFNQVWDKKQTEKPPAQSGFSETLRDCYEQGCNCANCFYNSFESLKDKCVMRIYVSEFIKMYGQDRLLQVI